MSAIQPLESIAIVGLGGRFPGARNPAELWRNLCAGVESIRTFTDEELLGSGIDPALIADPAYVRARSVLDNPEMFDAGFFGVTPRDAELTDPQHRVFLECAWHAFEDAGLDPSRFRGSVGVFAGASMPTYLLANIGSDPETLARFVREFQADGYALLTGNDKDYLATKLSYKLDLRGPSITLQTACSTSLVAVCQAVSALLTYQCDAALAGAVSITFPQARGHLYQEGAIASGDGHCRPFDAEATGTVFGSGCALVVLKRLSDALEEGDRIYAVIKGAAINNDGAGKVSYTAPGVDGQAEAIALAHALAGVTADTIGYVEAHGTATPLGDPIEVAALTQAFRATTELNGFCKLGSVKSNLGHLEAAAGVTGLIKTALALHHGQIPPTLHFKTPNPRIDFANSPFSVVTELTPWPAGAAPRRAGVSSFGVGGTNAHVVLEEAPLPETTSTAPSLQLFPLSARNVAALETSAAQLAAHFREHPEVSAASAAATLQLGRRAFDHRRIVAATSTVEAADLLERRDTRRVFTQSERSARPAIVFMFPGQGAQYAGMGGELSRAEPVFREALDQCAEIFRAHTGEDLAAAMRDATRLTQTEFAQPALFAVGYALAQLWKSWGIQPAAMIGHSVGEYVAAVLAEVMTLEDAVRLVAGRAKIVQKLPPGGMLAVRLPETEAAALANGRLSVAAANGPKLTVVSGPEAALAEAERSLDDRGIAARRLCTSHAFHSGMMEPAVAPFTALVSAVRLQAPKIPFVSNVTGRWITDSEATDPHYWAAHLRQTVRFSAGIMELLKEPGRTFLEVGPGNGLSQLARQHGPVSAMASLEEDGEHRSALTALGRLWLAGAPVDWTALHPGRAPRRVSLPGYPFERQRFWIEPRPAKKEAPASAAQHGLNGGAMPGPAGSAEELILHQLQVMAHQLETLRAGAGALQSQP